MNSFQPNKSREHRNNRFYRQFQTFNGWCTSTRTLFFKQFKWKLRWCWYVLFYRNRKFKKNWKECLNCVRVLRETRRSSFDSDWTMRSVFRMPVMCQIQRIWHWCLLFIHSVNLSQSGKNSWNDFIFIFLFSAILFQILHLDVYKINY